MTTGKTIASTRQTFVDKVMSLLFNMLSRLVITFLPRSNRLLISWLQSPSAVILEPPKIKSDTVSTVSPSISHITPSYTIIINKRIQNAVLGCSLKNDRMISVGFQGKPLNITVILVYAPNRNAEEGFLISSCYSLEHCMQMFISFFFSFAFLLSSFYSYL